MSKLIDADRLRAEIEKRIEATMGILHIPCHRREELEGLLSFVDSLQQEQPEVDSEIPNDLEEAAEEYLQKVKARFLRTLEHPTAKDCFKDGAKWDRQQMLKEAVDIEVVGEQRDLRLIDSTERCLFNAKRGDWLKIIIVKED